MMALIMIVVFAAAHVVRDGWPGFGEDQTFATRATATAMLGAAAVAYRPEWQFIIVALCVGIGFWLDHEHATGQQARDWDDAKWLLISGVTSLGLAVVAAAIVARDWKAAAALIIVAFLKPLIWWLAWRLPEKWVPTRIAAGAFGLLVGAALAS